MPPLPPYLTLAEVAAYLAISERTVRRLIAAGSLRARQFGIQWRIHRDDLAGAIGPCAR